jgi:SAM-dependent methyltransferase
LTREEFRRRLAGPAPAAQMEAGWTLYGQRSKAGRCYRSRIDRMVARCLGPRVLDVGCATGLSCRLLADRGDVAEVWGVDLCERAVQEARVNVAAACEKSQRAKVQLAVAWAEKLPFAAGVFDCVLAGQVLEHVFDAAAAAAEAFRVTRPLGRLVVSVPVGPSAMRCREHLRRFEEASLGRLLQRAGWQVGAAEMIGPWLVMEAQR